MKINKISIENFRCFRSYEVNFASQMTVLIGKNGSGKTTLINSILRALSFVFSKDTKDIETTLSISEKGVNIIQYSDMDAYFSHDELRYLYPVSIKCNALLGNKNTEWELLKKNIGGTLHNTMYKDSLRLFYNVLKSKQVLPLFAYFSDSYPHITSKVSKYVSNILQSGRPMITSFGYYDWDKETACTEMWQRRFMDCKQNILSLQTTVQNLEQQTIELKKVLEGEKSKKISDKEKCLDIENNIYENKSLIEEKEKEIRIYGNEFDYIRNVMLNFTSHIPQFSNYSSFQIKDVDIEYRDKRSFIVFTFKDNSKYLFQQLPAGYKRLFSIVFDIAYRSFILNNKEDSIGVVLIDEIDLHLHPELEQVVTELFRKTFPELQFIVTTHSPMVIANFPQDESNKVIRMSYKNGEYINEDLPNLYGIDYNTTVYDGMDVPARNSTIEFLINSYLRLIRRNNKDKALEIEEELKKLTKDAFSKIKEEIANRLNG